MNFLKKWRHKCWLKNLPDDKKAFFELYKEVNGFELSKQGRDQNNEDDISLTYGEIDYDTFTELLKKVEPKEGEIFYDLGCGVGKPVFCAALQFPFKKAIGVELLDKLFQAAVDCKHRYSGEVPASFMQGDFRKIDWSDGDVVFINATCYFGEIWQEMADCCKRLKPGSRLIITSKSLPDTDFQCLEREEHHMSWGFATVGVYIRR